MLIWGLFKHFFYSFFLYVYGHVKCHMPSALEEVKGQCYGVGSLSYHGVAPRG